jgi:hypothetical protein
MVALLALFAGGTVIYAANAAVMSVKMASAAAEGMHKGGCDQCPKGSNKASACNGICGLTLWATAVTGEFLPPVTKDAFGGSHPPVLAGDAIPPDPYPPRS